MKKDTPRSEPLGKRQTGTDGTPVTDGWTCDRQSRTRSVDTRGIEGWSVGDPDRGHRA